MRSTASCFALYFFSKVLLFLLSFPTLHCFSLQSSSKPFLLSRALFAGKKSKMPVFDADDEEELQRIMSGGANQKNIPAKKAPPPAPPSRGKAPLPSSPPTSSRLSDQLVDVPMPPTPKAPIAGPVKPLLKPNHDWRSAMSSPSYYSSSPSSGKAGGGGGGVQKPPTYSTPDPFELDFDYEDLELALQEEHYFNSELGSSVGVKHSEIVKVVKTESGLKSGEMIPLEAWSYLNDIEGKRIALSEIQGNTTADILIVLSDPRRMNDEFKGTLEQFARVPTASLKVNCVAVNCDDVSDMKKFIKRNTNRNYLFLSDSSKKVTYYTFFDLLTAPW